MPFDISAFRLDDKATVVTGAGAGIGRAGHQADELGVARDDELQIPADATSDLTGSSVQCQHVLVG